MTSSSVRALPPSPLSMPDDAARSRFGTTVSAAGAADATRRRLTTLAVAERLSEAEALADAVEVVAARRSRHRDRRRHNGSRPAGRRREDLQAVHRRGIPAVRVRPHLPGGGFLRRLRGQCRAGLPQGRQGCGLGRAQGFSRLVRRDRVQPRPGDLPDRRDAGGAPGAVRRPARWRPASGAVRPPPAGRRPGHRPTGAVRGLDGQDRRGLRRRESRCRAVLLVLHTGTDRGGRGDRAAGRPAARAGVGDRADHHLGQHLRRDREPVPAAGRRSPWPRCSPRPTCPAAWSTSSPATRRRSPRTWPRTATSTRWT